MLLSANIFLLLINQIYAVCSIQRINNVLIDQPSLKYAAFSKHILIVNKSYLCRHNMKFTTFKYAVFSNNIIRYLSRVPASKLFHIRPCCVSISCLVWLWNKYTFIYFIYLFYIRADKSRTDPSIRLLYQILKVAKLAVG
jgi:hypothetical protein